MRRFGVFFGIALVFLLKLAVNDAHAERTDDESAKVKITLFYESYCPFSVKFILNQLFPTAVKYHDRLEMDLVPFGHCKTTQEPSGKWDFRCQHGEKECYGNRVHACVIQQGRDKDPAKTVVTLACLMHFNYRDDEVQQCLKKTSFSWKRHKLCMTDDATDLEIAYGKRTHENVPKVKYVPFLQFNDVYNHTLEEVAVKNLEWVVCDLLGPSKPDTCPMYNYNLI